MKKTPGGKCLKSGQKGFQILNLLSMSPASFSLIYFFQTIFYRIKTVDLIRIWTQIVRLKHNSQGARHLVKVDEGSYLPKAKQIWFLSFMPFCFVISKTQQLNTFAIEHCIIGETFFFASSPHFRCFL